MKKIIDYEITSSASHEKLIQKVKELIENGWQPYYGLMIKDEDRPGVQKNIWFYQAMVKYEA